MVSCTGEEERWESSYAQLKDQQRFVKTRMLLASAFMVYLSNARESTRDEYTVKWVKIQQHSVDDLKEFNFRSTIGQQSNYSKWNLPSDLTIIENALIVDSFDKEVCDVGFSDVSKVFLVISFCFPSFVSVCFSGTIYYRSRWNRIGVAQGSYGTEVGRSVGLRSL